MQLGFLFGFYDPVTPLSENPPFQTHVNCLSHLQPTLIPLYSSMFIHDMTLTVAHQEVAGRRVAGCCEFPRWQHVKGRQTQRNKKCPNSIAVQGLGSCYEMNTQGIIVDMCGGSTYKSPHPGDSWSTTYFREINTLFSITDSQRQANIKRQGR